MARGLRTWLGEDAPGVEADHHDDDDNSDPIVALVSEPFAKLTVLYICKPLVDHMIALNFVQQYIINLAYYLLREAKDV